MRVIGGLGSVEGRRAGVEGSRQRCPPNVLFPVLSLGVSLALHSRGVHRQLDGSTWRQPLCICPTHDPCTQE